MLLVLLFFAFLSFPSSIASRSSIFLKDRSRLLFYYYYYFIFGLIIVFFWRIWRQGHECYCLFISQIPIAIVFVIRLHFSLAIFHTFFSIDEGHFGNILTNSMYARSRYLSLSSIFISWRIASIYYLSICVWGFYNFFRPTHLYYTVFFQFSHTQYIFLYTQTDNSCIQKTWKTKTKWKKIKSGTHK